MKSVKGFTLIELMIIIAIAGIILAIVIPGVVVVKDKPQKQSSVSYGVNGLTEVRCIDNYKFILSSNGDTRQIMDSLGHGVKCDETEEQPQDEEISP